MKTTITLLFILAFSTFTFSQTLKADYQFQGNLESSVPGAPNLIHLLGSAPNYFANDVVDGVSRQTLRFPFNSGLALLNTNTVIPNRNYTIVILFKFDNYNEPHLSKVLDFNNGFSQNGMYLSFGRFQVETFGNAATLQGNYLQAIFTMEEGEVRLRIFRDGNLVFNAANSVAAQITTENVLRFAQDDRVTNNEASAGNIARLRLYDAPMTTTQARQLDRFPGSRGKLEGRVEFSNGKPARNALITITDGVTGEQKTVSTNAFGYFHYPEITLNRSYSFTGKHKKSTIAARTLSFYSPASSVTLQAS